MSLHAGVAYKCLRFGYVGACVDICRCGYARRRWGAARARESRHSQTTHDIFLATPRSGGSMRAIRKMSWSPHIVGHCPPVLPNQTCVVHITQSPYTWTHTDTASGGWLLKFLNSTARLWLVITLTAARATPTSKDCPLQWPLERNEDARTRTHTHAYVHILKYTTHMPARSRARSCNP